MSRLPSAKASTKPDSRFERELLRSGFLIHDVSRLRHRLLDQHVRAMTGVTRHQWWLLVQLTRDGGQPMTQKELSVLVDIDKVPLGRLVGRLQQKGLVERKQDAVDRRSKRVVLSATGHELIRRMKAVALELGARIMADISLDEQQVLNGLLSRLKKNLTSLDFHEPPARALSVRAKPKPKPRRK